MRNELMVLGIVASGLGCAASGRAQDAAPDVPGLIVSLKTGDATVRAASARILGELGPQAKEAVPGLTEALKDESKDVRRNAIKSLGQMGPAAADAVPAIAQALGEASWETRRNAATALGGIGDRRAEEPLKKARQDPNDKVRAAAKRALKQLKK